MLASRSIIIVLIPTSPIKTHNPGLKNEIVCGFLLLFTCHLPTPLPFFGWGGLKTGVRGIHGDLARFLPDGYLGVMVLVVVLPVVF